MGNSQCLRGRSLPIPRLLGQPVDAFPYTQQLFFWKEGFRGGTFSVSGGISSHKSEAVCPDWSVHIGRVGSQQP